MAERQVLPLAAMDREQWRGELAKARDLRKKAQIWWDANLKAYAPQLSDDPTQYGALLNTNRDFTLVERKKADLFYQQPDIEAIPSPLSEDTNQRATLGIHTAILNHKLGLTGEDVKDLYSRLLFDVLCTAGTGFSVMGYEAATVPVETQQPVGEQAAPGSVLGLSTTPVMETVTVDVPIYEAFFWRYLSPKQMLIPSGFRSTRWDDAPYLGYDFEWPLAVVKAKGWVPSDFEGGPSQDELYFDYGGGSRLSEAVARGSVIWYKSHLYRPDRPHPQHLSVLIFLEGVDEPVEHRDSPYQTIDPQTGKLTPDSLMGFPIHPLTIRVLSDAAMVPSDCTVSRPLVNELNRFRGQMVEQRDATILRYAYNTDLLPTDALAKIVRSPVGGMIGLPGEAFVADGAIKELPHGTFPRENFSFNDYLDNDLARTHALDANQAGSADGGSQTATEASLRQSNANARLGFERGIVLDHYLRGITKYSTLLQRFLSVADAAAIVGPQKAQVWDGWRHQVSAAVAFTAMPDAALRHDLAAEQKRVLDEYTYFANDPNINRRELLLHIAPKLHLPERVIAAQPPAKSPEPTKPSFAFSGEDLNPLNPQYAVVMAILQQSGYQIPPEVIQESQQAAMNQVLAQRIPSTASGHPAAVQTEHGGKVAQAESLDKHQTDRTGGMHATGDLVAGNAGGLQ